MTVDRTALVPANHDSALKPGASGLTNAAVRRELNHYVNAIGRHLPAWFCRLVVWVRQPSRVVVRAIVSLLLILGSLLWFLPVLGLWMLPLALIVISQDVPVLQRPLLRAFQWCERRWKSWRRA